MAGTVTKVYLYKNNLTMVFLALLEDSKDILSLQILKPSFPYPTYGKSL